MSMNELIEGDTYSRSDAKAIVGAPVGTKGGNWDTGIVDHNGVFLIFANVGVSARTGHDYDNGWANGRFRWTHRTHSRLSWASVQQLIRPGTVIHLFCRTSNRSKFTYHGVVVPREVWDSSPVGILWETSTVDSPAATIIYPDEVGGGSYVEGELKQVLVNIHERNVHARQACIDHYGSRCRVCDIDFSETYGELGNGFIHVHHLQQLSTIDKSYVVDPIADLRPVCPNCHAMLHHCDPMLSLADLRARLTGS